VAHERCETPPAADRSHYNGADCLKKSVRQSRQESFALDIPFIELLITPDSVVIACIPVDESLPVE
jgi:hypothetical protein